MMPNFFTTKLLIALSLFLVSGISNSEDVALFVEVNPSKSVIRILNIKPKFEQGILLQKGKKYHIEASKSGYSTKKLWITLSPQTAWLNIELKKSKSTSIKNTQFTTLSISKDQFDGYIYKMHDLYNTLDDERYYTELLYILNRSYIDGILIGTKYAEGLSKKDISISNDVIGSLISHFADRMQNEDTGFIVDKTNLSHDKLINAVEQDGMVNYHREYNSQIDNYWVKGRDITFISPQVSKDNSGTLTIYIFTYGAGIAKDIDHEDFGHLYSNSQMSMKIKVINSEVRMYLDPEIYWMEKFSNFEIYETTSDYIDDYENPRESLFEYSLHLNRNIRYGVSGYPSFKKKRQGMVNKVPAYSKNTYYDLTIEQ